MTDPQDPVTWAREILALHQVPIRGETEDDERYAMRLLGQMVPGWDVSWAPTDNGYEVRGKANWSPVGVVRFDVEGQSLEEAAMLGLAMALDLRRGPSA